MKRCFDPSDCYDAFEPINSTRRHAPMHRGDTSVDTPVGRVGTPSPTLLLHKDALYLLEMLNGGTAADGTPPIQPLPAQVSPFRTIRHAGLFREEGGIVAFYGTRQQKEPS